MDFAICTVSAAPLRKEPSHRSEMTSQLLFGETMEVLDTKEEWLKIKSTFDAYEGWLTTHLVTPCNYDTADLKPAYTASGLVNPVTLPDQLINAPMGASLTGLDEETRLLWDGQHKYHGPYRKAAQPFDNETLLRLLQGWLNAPYLWGGRTFMGVDCSGFVQVVFKVLGKALKRDAYQQAEEGTLVQNLSEARMGDLAFFANENGKIIHVGILLNPEQIAHASGKVRIDQIDQEGIINAETGKRTHVLQSIRRFFPEEGIIKK